MREVRLNRHVEVPPKLEHVNEPVLDLTRPSQNLTVLLIPDTLNRKVVYKGLCATLRLVDLVLTEQ